MPPEVSCTRRNLVDRPRVDIYACAYMKASLGTTPDLFRAFADPTRLRILNLLLEREVCVCDLCTVLGEIQPKVSRHLAYLRRADLVTVRQQGKWKYYAIAKHPKGTERALINCVKTCMRECDALQDDLVRLRKADLGGCCA